MNADELLDLKDVVLDRLRAQPHLDVFDGSPDDAGQPDVSLDPDGRAHIYAALYFGAPVASPLAESICGARDLDVVSFQVTAAGGDQDRALRAAMKVRAALTGVLLTPRSGFCREQLDQLFAQRDNSAQPVRWFVPILYALDIP